MKTINLVQQNSDSDDKSMVADDTLKKILKLYQDHPITTKIIFFSELQFDSASDDAKSYIKEIDKQIEKNKQKENKKELDLDGVKFSFV